MLRALYRCDGDGITVVIAVPVAAGMTREDVESAPQFGAPFAVRHFRQEQHLSPRIRVNVKFLRVEGDQ